MSRLVSSEPEFFPPPWRLHGNGYIMFYRFSKGFQEHHTWPFPRKLGRLSLNLATVMLVDYQKANAGPYQELLFMPGVFRYGSAFYPSITKIYVSTETSIVNGRRNWGIPKEHATFQFRTEGNEAAVSVSVGEDSCAHFRFAPRGPALPLNTVLIPPLARTIMQPYEGTFYKVRLSGKGKMRWVRLLECQVNPQHFPDLRQGRLLGALEISDFDLHFPAPISRPWPSTFSTQVT